MRTEGNTILFIINSIQNPRCIKRVNEFIDKGYDVVVYAFNRSGDVYNNDIKFEINYLDAYSNNLSYIKRIPIIYRSIKRIVAENKKNNLIYYLFSLEVAMMYFVITGGKKYIYEESDLMHTYLHNRFLRWCLEKLDKTIIRKSLMTVFTSEGFRIYHFGEKKPSNCWIIPNKLSSDISQIETIPKNKHDNLRIGFVGHIRYESVRSFSYYFCKNFPNDEFHFFGDISSDKEILMFKPLENFPNCFFHGTFKTPIDLPKVYAQIDVVLSTYDVVYENVRYAEPNKLYEAIYFKTPIIVSAGCYLGSKVKDLEVGYTVDALKEKEVIECVKQLAPDSLNRIGRTMENLGKDYSINNNEVFFNKLSTVISNLNN